MEGHGYFAPYKHGKGLYLGSYKRGQGVITKKKKRRKNIKNACGCDNEHTVGKTHVSYFRGIFMHNALPISGARRNESGIVNLDDARGPGTHWVAYAKGDNHVIYFDSFDNF